MALLNNIETDVKVKCAETNTTQTKLGKAIGSTGQYINRLIKNKNGIVNKTYIKMLEAMGYDITLTYTPREATPTAPKHSTLDDLLK